MAGYIVLPISRDPAEAVLDSYAVMQSFYPGWQPDPKGADPMTALLNAAAVLYTDTATLATSMAAEAFRFEGRTLDGLEPIDAKPATGLVTFTATDTSGWEIPEDTQIAGTGPTGEPVTFATTDVAEIAPGDLTVSGVPVIAVLDGVAGNGVTGAGDFVQYLDFLASVTFDAPTSDGEEAETSDAYLDRLSEEKQLSSPEPIRVEDFAILGRYLAGTTIRATAIDGLDPRVADEAWRIDSTASGGSDATLTFDLGGGAHAMAVAWNETAGAVQAQLESYGDVDPGDVVVTGGPLSVAPLVITWGGAYASTAIADPTFTAAGFTGGTAALTIATQGRSSATGQLATVTVALIDAATGDTVGPDVRNAVAAGLEAEREEGFRVFVIDPTISGVDVSVEVIARAGWVLADVEDQVQTIIEAFLSPQTWGGADDIGQALTWKNEPTVRLYALVQRILGAESVDHIVPGTLLIRLTGVGSLDDVDLTLPGFAPLPSAGTISVTASGA